MNFDLISDLHLPNYYEGDLKGLEPSSSTLALLGDVFEVYNFNRVKLFFECVSSKWERILFVPGNHEYYHSIMENAFSDMRQFLNPYKNIHILDNDVVTIDGVRYIGSTLWSDMNKEDPLTKLACKDIINDYQFIWRLSAGKPVRITPEDTIDLFDKNIDFIKKMLELTDTPTNVVLTHHAPSFHSVSPRYIGTAGNGAFVSDLDDFILDHPEIVVWAHGHTHSPVDYYIGSCRVVGNPLGYTYELYKNDDQYKPTTIEVLK